MFHKKIDDTNFVVGLVNLTIHQNFRCGYLVKVFESIKNECRPWVCFWNFFVIFFFCHVFSLITAILCMEEYIFCFG